MSWPAFWRWPKRRQVTESDVKDHVKANLSRYKVPREVVFLDELPRNPTGKVLKRELAERESPAPRAAVLTPLSRAAPAVRWSLLAQRKLDPLGRAGLVDAELTFSLDL